MDCGGRRLDGDVQDYISLNVTCKSIQTASPHSLFCSLDLSLGSHLPSVQTFYLFFSFLLFLSSSSCLCLFVLPSSLLVLLFPLVLPISNFLSSCSFSHFFLLSSHFNLFPHLSVSSAPPTFFCLLLLL